MLSAQAAKNVSPELLHVLRSMPLITDAFIFDNPFIVGGGDTKLNDETAEACFRFAYGKGMSAAEFQGHVCAPMRAVMLWKKGLIRSFGQLAVTPATHRVIAYLTTPAGLKEVVGCLKAGTPLHGSSDADPGISDCHTLVKELKRLKEEGVKNSSSATAAASKESGQDSAQVPGTDAIGAMAVSFLALPSDEMSESDPLEKAIAQAASAKMDGLHFYTDQKALLSQLPAAVFPGWRLLFLVDSFTSRSKVTLDNLELVKTLACT